MLDVTKPLNKKTAAQPNGYNPVFLLSVKPPYAAKARNVMDYCKAPTFFNFFKIFRYTTSNSDSVLSANLVWFRQEGLSP